LKLLTLAKEITWRDLKANCGCLPMTFFNQLFPVILLRRQKECCILFFTVSW
jgi:hypothetical protein